MSFFFCVVCGGGGLGGRGEGDGDGWGVDLINVGFGGCRRAEGVCELSSGSVYW